MNITLYNFSKRKNSTKRPSGGRSVNAVLKENTSVDSPTFILKSNDFNINYVAAFGNYYWVTDVTSTANNLIEVSCKLDVLATFKDNILSSSLFVERSSSAYDTKLVDPYVSIKNEEVSEAVSVNTTMFDSLGTFVVSVLNDIGSGAGYTTYYALSIWAMQSLAHYCNQNLGDVQGIEDLLQWVQATFLKTSDAVVNCIWLPVSLGTSLVGGNMSLGETLKIGKDEIAGVTGNRFTGTVVRTTQYIADVPYTYSDFRKGNPYTKAFVYLPFYGMYQFNPLDFPDTIKIRYDVDIATGDTTVYLINKGSIPVSTINFNMGVTCPVGKVGNEAGGAIASTFGAIAGTVGAFAATGAKAIASGVGAAASAINGVTAAAAISPSVRGSQAGRSMVASGMNIIVETISHLTTDPANLTAIVGRPLMQYRTLSGLSGYVKTSEASVNVSANDSERSEINSLLDAGVYIE